LRYEEQSSDDPAPGVESPEQWVSANPFPIKVDPKIVTVGCRFLPPKSIRQNSAGGLFGREEPERGGRGNGQHGEFSNTASNFAGHGILSVWTERTKMPDETPSASINRELATKITAAYVRRNQVASDQLGTLISTVHQALASLGKQVTEVGARTPAVPIRRSVHHDYVVCFECGWRGLMLRRHLATGHGLTVEQYRARWSLPREHPMVAPGYSERRSSLAKQIGLGRGRRASREEPEPVAPEAAVAPHSRSRRRGRPRSATTSA
jgi:predicted transcriptional regulator